MSAFDFFAFVAVIAFFGEAMNRFPPRVVAWMFVAYTVLLIVAHLLPPDRRCRCSQRERTAMSPDGHVVWTVEASASPATTASPRRQLRPAGKASGHTPIAWRDEPADSSGQPSQPVPSAPRRLLVGDQGCKRCNSKCVELAGGYCGPCHLAGRDAGYKLIGGMWVRQPVQDGRQGAAQDRRQKHFRGAESRLLAAQAAGTEALPAHSDADTASERHFDGRL